MEVLFINACIRGKEVSRTYYLCEKYLNKLKKENKDVNITTVDLAKEKLECLNAKMLAKRIDLIEKKEYSHPMFNHAKIFANADLIVIGAPYWDLSFPAVLKVYIENICLCGVTFHYDNTGARGGCKASELVYITTAGGILEGQNFGFDYLKGIAKMFGIGKSTCIHAEKLDIVGFDAQKIIEAVEI